MFKRIAILTALATTASSAAYAGPGLFGRVDADIQIRADGDRGHRADRYDRHDRYDRRGRYNNQERWVPLARNTRGAQDILMEGRRGRFQQLMVQGERGAPFIRQVTIEYHNGERQIAPLNQRLQRGETQVINVDRPHQIRRVMVFHENSRGSYSVFGA